MTLGEVATQPVLQLGCSNNGIKFLSRLTHKHFTLVNCTNVKDDNNSKIFFSCEIADRFWLVTTFRVRTHLFKISNVKLRSLQLESLHNQQSSSATSRPRLHVFVLQTCLSARHRLYRRELLVHYPIQFPITEVFNNNFRLFITFHTVNIVQ